VQVEAVMVVTSQLLIGTDIIFLLKVDQDVAVLININIGSSGKPAE
jgi:hypothetical protein